MGTSHTVSLSLSLSLSLALSPLYKTGHANKDFFYRKKPYEGMKPQEIAKKVKEGMRPDIPDNCTPAYKELMTWCWAENPQVIFHLLLFFFLLCNTTLFYLFLSLLETTQVQNGY